MSGMIISTLKIIGLILLIILALFLLLILLELFVPIRYRQYGRFDSEAEDRSFYIKASWLLHIVCLKIYYKDGFRYVMTFFGIPIRRRVGRERRRRRKEEPGYRIESYDDIISEEEEGDGGVSAYGEASGYGGPGAEAYDSATEGGGASFGEAYAEQEEEENRGLLSRLEEFLRKLFDFRMNYRARLSELRRRLRHMRENPSFYVEFIKSEENREKLAGIASETAKLIKHVMPRYFDCFLRIGTGDPALTGELLSFLAVIYPLFGGGLRAEGNFERSVFFAELSCRGRIRLFTCLLIAYKIYFNKDLRGILRSLRRKTKTGGHYG